MAVTATVRQPAKDAAVTAAVRNGIETIAESHVVEGVLVNGTTTVADFDSALVVEGKGYTEVSDPDDATVGRETKAVAVQAPAGAVDRPAQVTEDGAFEGEFGTEDIKFPTLCIVQGSQGPLVERFSVGSLVFGEEALFDPPKPKQESAKLNFVPIKVTKSFREVLSKDAMDAGEMSRFFRSIQEVEEAGLTTRWIGKTKPSAEPSARIIMLIQSPEGLDHPAFGLEFDGKRFAVGIYYAKGRSYDATAKVLQSNYHMTCWVPLLGPDGKPVMDGVRPIRKKLLWKNVWQWTWGTVKCGEFFPWRPKMTQTKVETTAEVREFIEQSFGNSAQADVAE